MAAFEYVAYDVSGRRMRGVVNADSARFARRQLRQQRLTPIRVTEVRARGAALKRFQFERKASRDDIAGVTRMLAALIAAALPVEEALEATAAQTEKQHVRSMLMSIRARVMEGYRFSEALKEYDAAFPLLYRSMVAAGETAGELGAVMTRLADYLEKTRAMRQKIVGALIYPAALVAVAIAVVAGLMTFVVPKVVEQFATLDQDLPAITVAMIFVSDVVRQWGLAFALVLAAGVFLASRALRAPARRMAFDRMLIKAPVVGRVLRDVEAARFARTLATLTASGTPLVESLAAATGTIENVAIRRAADQVAAAVAEGVGLGAALRRAEAFPPMMVYMASSGEKSGDLAPMLEKVADQMDDRFEQTTSVAIKLMEPAIIITMGGVVMMIVLAIMLPILRMNSMTLL